MVLEVGKSYLRDFYHDNMEECIKKKDGIVWTPERVKAAFNQGNGTEKDLKRYIKDNKKYAYFANI
ncbi:MAG: hypothetical protein HDQ99_02545 [Lachnospiraceae bacterium]|nr:hypothetical protein [Lachnospiraceae bacterium]